MIEKIQASVTYEEHPTNLKANADKQVAYVAMTKQELCLSLIRTKTFELLDVRVDATPNPLVKRVTATAYIIPPKDLDYIEKLFQKLAERNDVLELDNLIRLKDIFRTINSEPC